MNTIKQHFSLLIPIIALLFALESIFLLNRAMQNQESTLTQNYSIMIASKTPLKLASLQEKIVEVKAIVEINPSSIVSKLKKNLDGLNLNVKDLPFFYSVSLEYFPSKQRLEAISAVLKKTKGIIRVEAFSKTHTQVYSLLSFIKFSVQAFSFLMLIISLLLMLKQIEVWGATQKAKMEIMDILGASVWIRNRNLFKLAFIDSIISTILVIVFFTYLFNNAQTYTILESLDVSIDIFDPFVDFLKLIFIGFLCSFASVIFVIVSNGKK